MGDFRPVVHSQGRLCEHTAYAEPADGYALDCDRLATFVRSAEYGGHVYACSQHVTEMQAHLASWREKIKGDIT